jgi:hypothetical protein
MEVGFSSLLSEPGLEAAKKYKTYSSKWSTYAKPYFESIDISKIESVMLVLQEVNVNEK